MSLARRAGAELLGTAFLLAAVVGSGIMGERLAGGNAAIALLANSLATGFALIALIVAFAGRSGAHFNPVVTVALAIRGRLARRDSTAYIAAQLVGAMVGVVAAHLMFDLDVLQAPGKVRSGIGQWSGELIATFGLVFLVLPSPARTSGPRHLPSAATLPQRTGSPRRPHSQTRQSRWRADSPIRLPA